MKAPKKSKSPYARHGKKEFLYSDLLGRWVAAIRTGAGQASQLGDEHTLKFGGLSSLRRRQRSRTLSGEAA